VREGEEYKGGREQRVVKRGKYEGGGRGGKIAV